MTYSRARLRLGILNVGFVVVAAVVALAFDLPELVLRFEPTPTGDIVGLGVVAALYVVANAPFDIYGGYVLPSKYEEDAPDARGFVASWARGAFVQAGAFVSFGTALMYAGREGGPYGAVVVFFLLTVFLFAARPVAARLVGGFEVDMEAGEDARLDAALAVFDAVDLDRPRVAVYTNDEPAFSGGFAGTTVIVPSSWLESLEPDELAVALARRAATLSTYSERRGVAVAVGWNTVGFLVAATSVPGAGFEDVAAFTSLVLGYVLWSFIGLLVLPTVNRWGVYEVDRATVEAGIDPEAFERAAHAVDATQTERQRPDSTESVFYPIPSVEDRVAHLGESAGAGAWGCARTRLYLSWAGLDFLSRGVHCNVGKPELWVYPPTD